MTLTWAVTVAATGLLAWLLPARSQLVQPLLLAHLVLGAATAIALGLYVPRHLAATRDRRRPASRGSGWALAGLGALVLAGGALAAVPRDLLGANPHRIARTVHAVMAFAGVALLWWHRLAAPRDELRTREMAAVLGVLAAVAIALAWSGRARLSLEGAVIREQAALRAPSPPAPLAVLAETERCAECHADIVEQWNGSAHRFASFANPFYLHALQTLEKARGREVTRFCAGCHDPLPLMAGVFEGDAPLSEGSPLGDRGVTCLVCHTTFHAGDPRGNGAIDTAARLPLWPGSDSPAPDNAVSAWLTRVAPRAHAARLSSPLLKTAAFCGACHKVGLPATLTGWRFVRGFNDADPWQQSAFSHAVALPFGVADEKSCAACHMPKVPSHDRAARDHQVLDHRFAAANTALAAHFQDPRWLERETEMLREARAEALPLGLSYQGSGEGSGSGSLVTPIDGGSAPAGVDLTLHVLVTAPGVGHQFPGGTLDSHETWVELEVANQRGEVIARHGRVVEDGGPDESAHLLRARPLDADGEAIVERDAFRTRTVLYNHTATAGAGELVRYRFSLRPDDGRITVTTRLWFRKFAREFVAAVYRRRGASAPPPQPRVLLNQRSVQLTVGEKLAPGPCSETVARTLLRYAPSATLQGDTTTATRVAQAAARCGLPGPAAILEARAALRSNRPARAVELATSVIDGGQGPRDAARMVRALGEVALGDDPAALVDLDALALLHPADREVWKTRARLLLRTGAAARAMADAEAALRVDPEDASACWVLMIAAGESGAPDVERRARRCYEAFREDETQRQLARLRRDRSPADDLEAEPIHIHEARTR